MSLMKSFNFNFFKQNIKKSKGTIILSLIIVPLIISIGMVTSGINTENTEFISSDSFGVINLIFMYIIPFVYSIVLFGFVFKKPSTDFMNSMPINRKTMFVTNTIGGIILITIIQLLSAFTVLLWGGVFGNLIVFPMEVLENMLLAWCSYVFVFVSANLAMTISGTLITQIVVTVLILFLIPFCNEEFKVVNQYDNTRYYSGEDVYNEYDMSITDGYQVTHYDLMSKVENYTMPFKLPRYGVSFSRQTIAKMLILSALYYFIGYKLYQKRKMEDNEESFGSIKLHIFVKALTLIPVILFANFANLSEDLTAFVIIVIFSAIYYFVFDLIVKRKIPIKVTVMSFIATIFIIQASIATVKTMSKTEAVDIDYEDIKAVSVGRNTNSKTSIFFSYYYDDNLIFDGDYFIKDPELLDLVLKAKSDRENKNEDEYYSNKTLYFNVKLNSGKEYYTRIYISDSNYQKIVKYLENNEQYIKHLKNNILENGGVYLSNDQVIDKKTEKIINKEIKNNLQTADFSKLSDDDVYYIEKTVYNNHKLLSYRIPIDLSDNMLKTIAEASNNLAVKNIRGYRDSLYASVYSDVELIGSINNKTEMLEFMEENADKNFNPELKYYIIKGGLYTQDGYKDFVFYTNRTTKIDNMLRKSGYSY